MAASRFYRWAEFEDRASHERVANYCRAIKASDIGNSGAARHFTAKAQQWERIRQLAARLIIRSR